MVKPRLTSLFSAAVLVAALAFGPPAALSQLSKLSKPGSGRFPTARALPLAEKGSTLPALCFSWAGDFSQGLAPVLAGGKYGFIDTLGLPRIATEFAYAGGFSENRAPVLVEERWGYLDVTGKVVIPPVYGFAGAFKEGFAPVAGDSGQGFIDSNGVNVGGMAFSDARPFSGGLAAVRLDLEDYAAWGFMDRHGELVIPPLFTDVPGGFSEGLAVVRVESEMPYRSGYIDSSGGFAIDTLYDAAGDFHQGLAPVGRGEWRGNRFRGKWGYVDTSGRLVTPLAYAWAGAFRDGKALVRMDGGGFAWIGRSGRILSAFREELEVIRPEEGDLVTYKLHGACGFLDSLGRIPTETAFAEAGTFRQGWARVRLIAGGRDVWGYIGRNGRYLGGSSSTESR